MNFKSSLRRKPNIKIIPMIDVLFFLLVFFMLFTTFRTSPTGIDINLPAAETVSEQSPSEIVITIDEQESIYMEQTAVDLSELQDVLNDMLSDNYDTLIIIEADRRVSYDRVVDVMDNVRTAGGYRLALSADRKN